MVAKNNTGKPAIAALCGKGGVGKTSISALTVKILCEDPDARVLAIDADPATGLATALGINVRKTVDDVRNLLIDEIENRSAGDRSRVAALIDYELLSALEERDNLAFLAIGRPETDGCYCQVNDLLKDVIETLSENFDYVVIDGEAGIEQINRRVMESVTHLILVSDQSKKGLNVVSTLNEVASRAVNYDKTVCIINRVRPGGVSGEFQIPAGITLAGYIPEDDIIREMDIAGASLAGISESGALTAVRECLIKTGLTA